MKMQQRPPHERFNVLLLYVLLHRYTRWVGGSVVRALYVLLLLQYY